MATGDNEAEVSDTSLSDSPTPGQLRRDPGTDVTDQEWSLVTIWGRENEPGTEMEQITTH